MKSNPDLAIKLFPDRERGLIKKLFSRDGISEETRLICSIAFLQAEDDHKNLTNILNLYINNEEELRKAYETLLQGYLFCGYPRAIESFFCLNEALREKAGLSPKQFEPVRLASDSVLLEKGETAARRVHRDKYERIRNKISDFSPDLGYLMIAEGYGHVLSRDGLDLKLRELAVISSLTALGADRQLYSHIRGARNVGCGDFEIYEALFTGIIWIAPEKVANAIDLWTEITGKKKIDSINDFK